MTSSGKKSILDKWELYSKITSLNEEQKRFCQLVLSGNSNVFLTSAAGCGKSFTLNHLFDFCKDNNIHIAKTASTGVAAITIKAQTLHAFCGVGLAQEDVKNLIKTVGRNKKAKRRIENCNILFIDEISMIDSVLLDKLDIIFKYYRFNNKPYGGIQLICSGDALQLPPVSKGGFNEKAGFFFEARSWKEANIQVCNLVKIMRQDDKSEFALALNKIRFGDISSLGVILQRQDKKHTGEITPINLFPLNNRVNSYNQICLDALPGSSFYFHAVEVGEDRHKESLERNCLAPKTLELKIGAQVMLLSNLNTEMGWVNGTLGKVISIENNNPVIRRSDGQTCIVDRQCWEIKEAEILTNGDIIYRTIASRQQIPLKLGWAVSVHKSQSLTMEEVMIDFAGCFEYGQCYTALSRCKSLSGLYIKNLKPEYIKAHPKAVEFYKNLENNTN